ncbi:hypothetical protein RI129_002240 [Pyrocoelia pectoralis]|uniref:Uncharacterized protein n=1 Tax=Pyrocoelia pectoralis TaxID=417401 RepID=A0AAN7ZT08_9COLE
MKQIILFSMCIYLTLSLKLNQDTIDKWNEHIRPHVENCINESGVKKDLADSLFTNLDYPDDGNLRCYMDCMVRRQGLLDSNNKFDKDKIASLTPEGHQEVVDLCIQKAEQLSGPCENGYTFASCVIRSRAEKENP